MRDVQRRLERLEQQVDAVLGPAPLTPEELASAAAEWNAKVTAWAERLLETVDLERHYYLLLHWTTHLLRKPCIPPCPVPPGLIQHIDILWGWRGDATKPVALPAAVVEAYLRYPDLPNRAWPWIECECSYPIPIVGFFNIEHTPPKPQVELFSRCPICASPYIGWKAHSILTKAPGFATLIPYSQR